MCTVGMWRLFPVMALTAGLARAAGAQEPQAPTREAAIEQAQAEKAKTLHPYVPNKAERFAGQGRGHPDRRQAALHPFFESAYSGGGFTLGAGLRASREPATTRRRARQLHDLGLQASRGRVHRRRACSTAAARCRSSAAGAKRRRSASTASGPTRRKTTARTTRFQQPYGSALLTLRPTRRTLDAARRGSSGRSGRSSPARAAFPSVETVYTPETLPGLGAEPTYLHSQGTVGFDWRTVSGYSRRGGFYGVTVHDYTDSDDAFGFQQVDYEAIQHIPDPARGLGHLAPRAGADRVRQGRSADSVLHAAVARRRLDAARLRELALPRSEQPAAAGGVAHHGQPLLRHRGVLRRRQGRGAHVRSRFPRAEDRLRFRRPLPRAARHRRCASRSPRAAKALVLVFAAGRVF